MRLQDFVINLTLSAVLIVGAYQFYFFTQRYQLVRVRTFSTRVDDYIPFVAGWSWVYSFLYYPAILYLNWLAVDAHHFVLMAFSFMILLAMQMLCFMLFPVATPDRWRTIGSGSSYSERFLRFVRKFDAPTNCFPSMHVSVAMLTALHAFPTLGSWVFAFPVLIAISCIFTKQHYLVDLPFGALLGWIAFLAYSLLV